MLVRLKYFETKNATKYNYETFVLAPLRRNAGATHFILKADHDAFPKNM